MATNNTVSVIDAVGDAIRYYRYRGVTLKSIDSYAGIRCKKLNAKRRNEALEQLQADGYVEKRGKLWFLQPIAFKSARGDSYAPEFQDMDFPIAFALACSEDSRDLNSLISSFDFVIRSLPSFDEVYGGLNRLVAARLIKQKRGCYESTPQARELLATAESKSKRSVWDQLQTFKRLILCPCCGSTLKRVCWRVPLSEREYSAALKTYRASRQ